MGIDDQLGHNPLMISFPEGTAGPASVMLGWRHLLRPLHQPQAKPSGLDKPGSALLTVTQRPDSAECGATWSWPDATPVAGLWTLRCSRNHWWRPRSTPHVPNLCPF